MINILNKEDCCGCSSCAQRCPKECIEMLADEQGFLYPNGNKDKCIDCGLCEKACPVINPSDSIVPLDSYAAINTNDNIRNVSSSGGVFSGIAEHVIISGGVVFGAKFNEKWEVVHSYTEDITGLSAFRGSKYVQSSLGSCYKEVEEFLRQGRTVLFTGTPCQIAGLKKYLRKDYDSLYTVDIVCHGVPSPLLWQNYIEELSKNYKESIDSIKDINFRNKEQGWNRYCFSIKWSNKELKERRRKNLYMRGYLANLFLRPSCSNCPAKSFKSGSDITIGDFWGIEAIDPQMFDDKGTTLFIVNTCKGDALLQQLSFNLKRESKDVLKKNPVLWKSSQKNELSTMFWERYNKSNSIFEVSKLISDESSFLNKIMTRIKRIIK